MAKPLTPIAIANLRPRPKDAPKRYEVSDGGCAGLRVVVFPSGKRSFIARFRFRSVQRKLTLGPCLIERNGEGEPDTSPEIDTPLSLAAARELATKALRQARSGSDPAAAKARAAPGATCGRIRHACSHRRGISAPRWAGAAHARSAPQRSSIALRQPARTVADQ
jgi:hypothetical protein